MKCFIASLRERRHTWKAGFCLSLKNRWGPAVPFTRLCPEPVFGAGLEANNHRDGADESAQLCDEAGELSGDVRGV